MLKSSHPSRVLHQDALCSSWRFLCQQPWSTLMTVWVMAVSLVLVALCGMTTQHMAQWRASWQSNGHISLYINPALAPAAQQTLVRNVRAMPGVAAVSYISAAEGLALLTQQAGLENVAAYLPHNPLPAVIEVTPDVTLHTPAAVNSLYKTLQSLADVEDARLDGDWMKRTYAGLSIITQLSQYLMLILGLMLVLVIGNTLRLSLYHRQAEIEVLQLLGAPNSFIMRPFLYTAIWYALLASCGAWVLLKIIWLALGLALRQWATSYPLAIVLPTIPLSIGFGVFAMALALATLSTYVTVKWYLLQHDSIR